MTAVGIHAHPTRKLGRRPAQPSLPRAQFADFLKVIPAHPIASPAPGLSYPMDENDKWGDCVVAGADHALQLIHTALTGSYTNWTTAQILAAYRTQNPTFDPASSSNGPGSAADGGMNIQQFLSWMVKQGLILGFAAVNVANPDELKAATYLGLAIVTGEDLQVAQQSQQTWDYVPSADWGGHCTVWGGYHPNLTCITWGHLVDMTPEFITHQVGEAWFILTRAHVEHPTFRAGFDLAKFGAAYTALTGRPFPAVTPPVDLLDAALVAALDPWAKGIVSRLTKSGKAAAAYRAWKQAKGYGS